MEVRPESNGGDPRFALATGRSAAASAVGGALEQQVDVAILGLNHLTSYGEDAVWRPADKARTALIAAREEIGALKAEVAKLRRIMATPTTGA